MNNVVACLLLTSSKNIDCAHTRDGHDLETLLSLTTASMPITITALMATITYFTHSFKLFYSFLFVMINCHSFISNHSNWLFSTFHKTLLWMLAEEAMKTVLAKQREHACPKDSPQLTFESISKHERRMKRRTRRLFQSASPSSDICGRGRLVMHYTLVLVRWNNNLPTAFVGT